MISWGIHAVFHPFETATTFIEDSSKLLENAKSIAGELWCTAKAVKSNPSLLLDCIRNADVIRDTMLSNREKDLEKQVNELKKQVSGMESQITDVTEERNSLEITNARQKNEHESLIKQLNKEHDKLQKEIIILQSKNTQFEFYFESSDYAHNDYRILHLEKVIKQFAETDNQAQLQDKTNDASLIKLPTENINLILENGAEISDEFDEPKKVGQFAIDSSGSKRPLKNIQDAPSIEDLENSKSRNSISRYLGSGKKKKNRKKRKSAGEGSPPRKTSTKI